MKIRYFIFVVAAFVMSVPAAVQAQLPDFTSIVDSAKDSVVNISTKNKTSGGVRDRFNIPEIPEGSPFGDLLEKFLEQEEFQNRPRERERQSLGSGFIVSKDGYILTNHHVIAEADEVIVRMSNRAEYVAEVIGSDKASDVAVLKVDADNLPMLEFGDSDQLKVGEWVLAIGSPFGFDASVTAGIVSAKGRNLPSDNYVPFIQTDVAINPGNSGGPLFNMDGEVIGINSQIYSRTGGFMGLSFAIPIEMAVDVADQIREKGYVSRGWLGVLIQEVNRDLAESFGMDTPHGALVARVMPGSPSEEAGLQPGDVIVAFNGRKVTTSSSLPPMVGRAPVDKFADVTVIRDKTKRNVRVKIAELPDSVQANAGRSEMQPRSEKTSVLGMEVETLTDEVKKALKVENGVVVESVDRDGPAVEAGIVDGDVISKINNQDVSSVDEFKAIVAELDEGKLVPILIQRRGGPVFLAIRP